MVTGYSDALVNNSTVDSLSFLGFTCTFGLLIGICGAVYLARHVKKILFGLEPEAIATLLQERNVILNSVREGVINVNADGVITLINQEALTLLAEANLSNVLALQDSLAGDTMPEVPWNEVIAEGRVLNNAPVKLGIMCLCFGRGFSVKKILTCFARCWCSIWLSVRTARQRMSLTSSHHFH